MVSSKNTVDLGGRIVHLVAFLVSLFVLSSCSHPVLTQGDPDPSLKYGSDANGCADIMVYKSNSAETEFIVVNANLASLGLTKQSHGTFYIDTSSALRVSIDMYPSKPSIPPYCTDVLFPQDPTPTTWKAVSGEVTITTTVIPNNLYEYHATVRLQGVTFTSPDGRRQVVLQALTFDNVGVGWYPG